SSMQSSYRDQRDRRQSREGSGERVGKERVSIRGSSLSVCFPIRAHQCSFSPRDESVPGRTWLRKTYTKGVYKSKRYLLTLPVKTAITTHLRVPSEQTPNPNQNKKPQNKT